MALKHQLNATNPQSPTITNTDWNAAHVIDSDGLTFSDSTVQKTAWGAGATRSNKIGAAGTSIAVQHFTAFAALYADYFKPVLNGGGSGKQSQWIADRIVYNAIDQGIAYCILIPARNDMGSGSINDTPTAGAGSVGNALYYLPKIVKALRSREINVVLCSEPPYQGGAGTIATNILAWNAYLPGFVAALNDPGVIFSDTASAIANTSTGAPLIPTITVSATGSSGASTVTVSSSAGMSVGQSIFDSAGVITSVVGKPIITNIAGNVLTLSGPLSGNLSGTVSVLTDYEDATHLSPVGLAKTCAKIFTDMQAAGWTNHYSNIAPMSSNGATAGLDNLVTNGDLTGSVTSGVGSGWANFFLGTPSVVSDSRFRSGKAQKAQMIPGETFDHALNMPGANVRAYRGRRIAVSLRTVISGFIEGACRYSIGGSFVNNSFSATPPNMITSFGTDAATPFNFQNIQLQGNLVWYSEVYVPWDADQLNLSFTTHTAMSAQAPANGIILAGDLIICDIDDPIRDARTAVSSIRGPITTAPTLDQYDGVVLVDATTASRSFAWPAANLWRNQEITVTKTDSSANTVTVTGGAGSKASVTLTAQDTSVTARSDGTNIYIIGSGGSSSIVRSINVVSTNTTMGSTSLTDYVYFCSGTMNLTLPTAAGNTNRYTVKVTGGATTIVGTLDGTVNPVISVTNTSLDIISDGTNWRIV